MIIDYLLGNVVIELSDDEQYISSPMYYECVG